MNLQAHPAHTAGAGYYVGVDVGATIIRAGVFSRNLRLLGKTKLSTKIERGPEAVIGRIARCILYATDECDLPASQIEAVGVGVSGRIEARTGTVIGSSGLAWNQVALGPELRRLLSCPVLVANSHNLATFGVYAQELADPPRSFAALFLGPQVVGGVMLGDQFLDLLESPRAEQDFEDPGQNVFGILPHPEFGSYRSRDFRKALRKGRDHPAVRQFLLEIARQAGAHAAQLVTWFAPEVIAFGGGVMDELGAEIMTAVSQAARAKLGCELADRAVVVTSALGDLAGITGAAAWAMRGECARPALASVALDTVH